MENQTTSNEKNKNTTEINQLNKLYDLFNQEQGTFAYYTCGLLVLMIGYSFNIVIESTGICLILPIIGILIMFISFAFGLYFIKYRLSNYYNNFHLLHKKINCTSEIEKKTCIEFIEKNSEKQSKWYNIHWWTIFFGPFLMFIWLFINYWYK
jgi:hypothetical protein